MASASLAGRDVKICTIRIMTWIFKCIVVYSYLECLDSYSNDGIIT